LSGEDAGMSASDPYLNTTKTGTHLIVGGVRKVIWPKLLPCTTNCPILCSSMS